ncbi:MAG: hypothetical protein OHK0053_11220 [Microscillaceae bacterium]
MLLFITIALLIFITQSLFSSWWLLALDAFAGAVLLGRSAGGAFLAGFFGAGLVWGGYAFFLNQRNEGLLLSRIAELFHLPSWGVYAITMGIAALVGGLAAWSGYSLRALWWKKPD